MKASIVVNGHTVTMISTKRFLVQVAAGSTALLETPVMEVEWEVELLFNSAFECAEWCFEHPAIHTC